MKTNIVRKIILILFVILISFSWACKSKRTKPMFSDVQGLVKLYDPYGRMISSDSVLITLSNIDNTGITDSSGMFYIEDVPVGTYTITFTKDGFPEYKIYDFQVLGNGQSITYVPTVYLAHYPTLRVENFRDTAINSFLTDIKADIVREPKNSNKDYVLIAYISSKSNVSINNYEEREMFINNRNYIILGQDFSKLQKGEYVVFYAYPSENDGSYYDDTVAITTYSLIRNEYGDFSNPYYYKVSDVYHYQ